MTSRDVDPVSVVIADDEPIAREGLRAALGGWSWVQCIGEAASGAAAIEVVNRLRPDLLFLDIEMPGGNGLDVVKHIGHRPFIIFTTAWSQHAVTAFELGALDYLLKPFGPDRLRVALERARAAIGEPVEHPAERLHEAMRTGPMTRLFVRSGASVIPVAVEAITHLEAWGDYVTAHTLGAKYVLHVALHRLEERLDPTRFIRVHRAHLVNLGHVKAFRAQGGGQLAAELVDGRMVPVSRTHARAVRALSR